MITRQETGRVCGAGGLQLESYTIVLSLVLSCLYVHEKGRIILES